MRKLVLGTVVGLFVFGCEADSSTYPNPDLTPDEVLAAVTEYLVNRETQLEDYEINLIGFDYVDRDWRVGFDGKSGIVGDHFWVTVSDDDISDISLQPGL
jgi:hypothetical protein